MTISCTVKNQFLEDFPNDSKHLELQGRLHCYRLEERFEPFKSEKQCDSLHPLDTGKRLKRRSSGTHL